METVFDPRLGVMVDRRTGLPVDGNATPPQRVNALTMIGNDTGLTPRLNALNQMFNPMVAIGEAGQSAQNMLAPGRTGWERVGRDGSGSGISAECFRAWLARLRRWLWRRNMAAARRMRWWTG